MNIRTFVGWISIVVVLSLAIGFSVGVGVGHAQSAPAQEIDATGAPVPAESVVAENEALKALLEKTNVGWKKTIDGLAECNAQYSESTILVAGGPPVPFTFSFLPSTGRVALNTSPGDARSVWVIPQRIRRVMTVNGAGSEFFYYTDLRTGKLDGPYVPLPATPKIWSESQ